MAFSILCYLHSLSCLCMCAPTIWPLLADMCLYHLTSSCWCVPLPSDLFLLICAPAFWPLSADVCPCLLISCWCCCTCISISHNLPNLFDELDHLCFFKLSLQAIVSIATSLECSSDSSDCNVWVFLTSYVNSLRGAPSLSFTVLEQ